MKSRWERGHGDDQHPPVEMRFIDMFMTALGSSGLSYPSARLPPPQGRWRDNREASTAREGPHGPEHSASAAGTGSHQPDCRIRATDKTGAKRWERVGD